MARTDGGKVATLRLAMIVAPRIGCSGWNYKSWRGHFYAPELAASKWLPHYASIFDTVEVNSTFYRLPDAATFAGWRAQTPRNFLMAVKASRYLTHLKRLRDPQEPVARLFERAQTLGPRLGPVLYQLPGNFHRDIDRLEEFFRALPASIPLGPSGRRRRRVQHVMEFRHPSWYEPETYALLERYGVSLCLHDKRGSEIMGPRVGPIVYVRFHGTSGHYFGSYDRSALREWAVRLADYVEAGLAVYAYFNNDPNATAVDNALVLREELNRLLFPRRSASRRQSGVSSSPSRTASAARG
jgi:uncharacterized protein YecE (DUF72 family)